MATKEANQMVPISAAAPMCGLHPAALYAMGVRGEIEMEVGFGGRWFVRQSVVDRLSKVKKAEGAA